MAAARTQQWADAAGLFENVSKLNPYNRDALYNLAVTYHELGQYDKMVPYLQRLVAVDPGNADNWLLLARAYNGLVKNAQKAKNTAQHRAFNDSTVKYYQQSEKMPVNVIFTEFNDWESKGHAGGTIENRSDAAKSLTCARVPRQIGQCGWHKEVAVPSVAPKAKSRFTTTIDGQKSQRSATQLHSRVDRPQLGEDAARGDLPPCTPSIDGSRQSSSSGSIAEESGSFPGRRS